MFTSMKRNTVCYIEFQKCSTFAEMHFIWNANLVLCTQIILNNIDHKVRKSNEKNHFWIVIILHSLGIWIKTWKVRLKIPRWIYAKMDSEMHMLFFIIENVYMHFHAILCWYALSVLWRTWSENHLVRNKTLLMVVQFLENRLWISEYHILLMIDFICINCVLIRWRKRNLQVGNWKIKIAENFFWLNRERNLFFLGTFYSQQLSHQ